MPRLQIEDCVSYDVKDVVYLTDYLIRFQLAKPRRISEYEEFVLQERSDIDSLWPGAPNRAAVLYNVNAVKKNLDNICFRIKKSWFARTHNIKSPLDFLRFSVEHKSNPTYLFTNGQTFVSIVVREQERFETVEQSLVHCPEECSEHGQRGDIVTERKEPFSPNGFFKPATMSP